MGEIGEIDQGTVPPHPNNTKNNIKPQPVVRQLLLIDLAQFLT